MKHKFFLLAILFFSNLIQAGMNDLEKVKQEITEKLSGEWKNSPQERPVIVLIGGFPGSGKTELTKAIHNTFESVIISFDAIRQELLDRREQSQVDGTFNWEIIRDVYQNLLKTALTARMNVIMDTNAHAEKIRDIEQILKNEQVDQIYQTLKICLNPPYETLVTRVRFREQISGLHQGTESDLIESFSSKKLDPKDYDLVIDNSEATFNEEWLVIHEFLMKFISPSLAS